MTDLRTAAQQALKVLQHGVSFNLGWVPDCEDAITALRAALAEDALERMSEDERRLGIQMQPVQEPLTEEEQRIGYPSKGEHMTEEIKLPGFGLAPIKMEGGIADPDEFTWECDLSKCAECNAKYVNWKRRYEEEQASIRTRGNT